MPWYDVFKIFAYAFTDDPIGQKDHSTPQGAGIPQPDAMPDIRANADGTGGGGSVRLRDTNDFVDLSTVTNRMHRYKEYQRLQSMAEVDMAMTVFADEACMGGDTMIATPAYQGGYRTLEWLTEHMQGERFLVYAFDFDKVDYTLAWAYDARLVKEVEAVKILLDDGSSFIVTIDHSLLTKNGKWKLVGGMKMGDELMPFYRIAARQELTGRHTNQHPRVHTHNKGWITERQFVDEWRLGKGLPQYANSNRYCRMLVEGLTLEKIQEVVGVTEPTIRSAIEKAGWSNKELKWLAQRPDRRRIVGIMPAGTQKVYDLSVEKYENFCTNWGVAHNCQKGENNKVFEIVCENKEVKEELDFLCFHRKMLNFDQKKIWNRAKNLFVNGDDFWEVVIDLENPKSGIVDLQFLPPDSMYRIETTKGRLIEFQQSKEGPDYQSLSRVDVTAATDADLQQTTAIRFAPEQIIHVKIGDDRKTFYPYGVSLIEAARGPAHQLRMMEDAMVVYRLCLVGNTRIRTLQSYKYLKDVQEGDRVICLYEHSFPLPTKVLRFVDNGIQDVLRVRSKHVELIGTKTHPVLVSRNGVVQYVDMQDLIPKQDRLINVCNDWSWNQPISRTMGEKWAKLSEGQRARFRNNQYRNKSELLRKCHDFGRAKQFLYAKGKALPYDKAVQICDVFDLDASQLMIVNKREYNSERVNLPGFVDENFARLFGFLCGDGNIHNGSQLSFASGENQEINDRYADLLKLYFGQVRFEQDKKSKNGLGKYVVDSTTACCMLFSMGYINDHKVNRAPEWVFRSNNVIRRAFVEGLSDADGRERYTAAGTWSSTIELGNEQLVEDVKELWSSTGLCSGQLKKRNRDGGHEIVEGRTTHPNTSYSVTITDYPLPATESVIEVTSFGQQNVYDITVEDECHNFIANGVPVHNTRAPERRVFYIDVQQLPPNKAEAFIERMKDQFKKKKVPRNSSPEGASSVEERWHAPAADEDFWIPIRPNANTRVETLPGAQNLGEIDDTVYFRNKLFIALNFPKNYLNNEDAQTTQKSLSSQDIKFARMIMRLQSHIEDAMWELCDRHLRLRGYPEESYEDLQIKMTPPSDIQEMMKMELLSGRIQNAGSLKGAQIMSTFDILTKFMKYPEEETKLMIARRKIEQLEELKLQIIAQNPSLLGVGLPPEDESQVSTEPTPDNPMMGGQPGGPGGDQPGGPGGPPPDMGGGDPTGGAGSPAPAGLTPKSGGGGVMVAFPEPEDEDVHKYDLEIRDFASEQDEEEQDQSEER